MLPHIPSGAGQRLRLSYEDGQQAPQTQTHWHYYPPGVWVRQPCMRAQIQTLFPSKAVVGWIVAPKICVQ